MDEEAKKDLLKKTLAEISGGHNVTVSMLQPDSDDNVLLSLIVGGYALWDELAERMIVNDGHGVIFVIGLERIEDAWIDTLKSASGPQKRSTLVIAL